MAYKTGFQCLLTFLTMSGMHFSLPELPVLTEDILIYFVTHCHSHLKLRWVTIKLYLAGVRFHYLQAGRENPFLAVDRLQYILRGIKKSQVNLSKPRLPIDSKILSQICCMLRKGLFSPALDKTLECMCLLGFYGFLRCAEFTIRSQQSHAEFLRVKDVEICQDNSMFTLILAESKTDPFRRGTRVFYFKNDSLLCPVLCMKSYLETVRREPLDSTAPLFVDSNNKPFSRDNFISYLRDILRRLGYNENSYSGHSLRIGSATQACSVGIEDNLIKTLGRWNSSCYTRFIKVHKSVLKDAQNKLIS